LCLRAGASNGSSSRVPTLDKGRPGDEARMRRALRLARRAQGFTSPNPMVGAVIVSRDGIIGEGWHRRAGEPHAEVEALRDAARRGRSVAGATLYVTLEPCSTHGRTPPCVEAILAAGIRRVVVGAIDPNPAHSGRGLDQLRAGGVEVVGGVLADECARLNEAFNHWIRFRTPWVIVKAAMTLDGKIATASGESKWITSPDSRRHAMRLRLGADAILVGVNTVLLDDPELSVRGIAIARRVAREGKRLRRVILDSRGRTPATARVVTDARATDTTVVVTEAAPAGRRKELEAHGARVWVAPKDAEGRVDRHWVLKELGRENVTCVLVEGGGEVNASFLLSGLAQRVAFFYAPLALGGATARKAVGGVGAGSPEEVLALSEMKWRRLGPDLFMTARVAPLMD
jgi:diaminohydroxyphosphoribosylaminopyrimidine deaminase/5-amino-6-(5-phosphoribosylamino)uracil reductase